MDSMLRCGARNGLLFAIFLLAFIHFFYFSITFSNAKSKFRLSHYISNYSPNVDINYKNKAQNFSHFKIINSIIEISTDGIDLLVTSYLLHNFSSQYSHDSFPKTFYCKLSNSNETKSVPYTISGISSCSSMLKTYLVVSCKIQGSQLEFQKFIQDDERMIVEIINNDFLLASSIVEWKSRGFQIIKTGNYKSSGLDLWKYYATSSPVKVMHEIKKVNVYICVSGVDIPPSKDMLPLYLEFVQHHLLLGAAHIFLGVRFDWDSSNMRRLLQVFSNYINEGTLTIHSQTAYLKHQDSNGLLASDDFLIDMFVRLSKSMADYIGVWDIDKFFIPKLPHNSIIDVIRSLESSNPSTIGKSSSISCYINITTIDILKTNFIPRLIPDYDWIGDVYSAAPSERYPMEVTKSRSRNPTELSKVKPKNLSNLSQSLFINMNTCDFSVCLFGEKYNNYLSSSARNIAAKTMSMSDVGSMYHFVNEIHHKLIRNMRDNIGNDYSNRFYPTVRDKLEERGLNLLITLPEKTSRHFPDVKDWESYSEIFNNVRENKLQLMAEILPAEKSETPIVSISELPVMAVDLSELFLGALLERVFDSQELGVTVFMLCHAMLDTSLTGLGAIQIRRDSVSRWKQSMLKFEEAKYTLSGQRESSPRYLCRISNKAGDSQYIVEGTFMPNRLTTDKSTNRRADILRCKMNGEYQYLAGSEENVQVEILRENEVLIKFLVPWRTRKTGYMLTVEGGDAATRFDPWKGYFSTTSSQLPLPHLSSSSSSSTLSGKLGSQGDPIISNSHHHHHHHQRLGNTTSQSDNIYMCVPGIETPPGRNILPLFLEFVQHHLLLGVDHMFLTASFPWGSPHMKRLLQIFASYIQEGSVSISSQAGDGIDYLNSFEGIYWNRNIPKVIFINMCLYLSKGMADYIGVWDIDEFFIPKLPHNSIIDVIRSLEAPANGITIGSISNSSLEEIRVQWKGGRGLADGDGHPFCYLSLSSLVVLKASDTVDPEHPWLGERFSHGPEDNGTVMTKRMGFKKSILPTRKIFQAGLHMSGACKLEGIWNGCGTENNEFCYLTSNIPRKKYADPMKNTFHLDHRFDEIVWDRDYKRVDPNTDALIYHYYSAHRDHLSAENRPVSLQAKQSISEYSSRFFPNVMAQLEARDLVRLISLPVTVTVISANITNTSFLQPISDANVTKEDLFPSYLPKTESIIDLGSLNLSAPSLSQHGVHDFFISALLERQFGSNNLWLTVFYLGFRVNAPTGLKYDASGIRLGYPRLFCHISHSGDSSNSSYIVQGMFIPNRQTFDFGSSKRLDILRCKMNGEYQYLAGSEENVQVEILRENEGPIFNFSIPWKTRSTGLMVETDKNSTRFNAWKGYSSDSLNNIASSTSVDNLYICVSGVDIPPSKDMLPLYLEFVQHHLLLGAAHIFLGVRFDWDSSNMRRLLQVFSNYINEGTLTITSQTMSEHLTNIPKIDIVAYLQKSKIIYINMCLYLSKGMADYIGVWDIDEFFIPKLPHNSIIDVIRSLEAPPITNSNSSSSTTLSNIDENFVYANGEKHLFCYLSLKQQEIHPIVSTSQLVTGIHWIGSTFLSTPFPLSSPSGLESVRVILPTRTMFQSGLHAPGGCELPSPWNGCEHHELSANGGFCYRETFLAKKQFSTTHKLANRQEIVSVHSFDAIISASDGKDINGINAAVLYRFVMSFIDESVDKNRNESGASNEYSTRFFPLVKDEISRRHVLLD